MIVQKIDFMKKR